MLESELDSSLLACRAGAPPSVPWAVHRADVPIDNPNTLSGAAGIFLAPLSNLNPRRVTAKYCSRSQPSGKFCRNIAPVRKWTEGQKKDLVFQEYRREYKRYFAWIKARKISLDEFKAWLKNF